MDQSSFHSVLGTNYVPTDQECEQITEFLAAGPETQLVELQAQISKLEAILQPLKEQYGDLQAEIRAHRALTSLFRRLPDDILREIFAHCLPHNRTPTMCAAEPPLLLTHVCVRWRQVAFSTPHLWSSLHISDYLYGDQILETEVSSRDEDIRQWIGRAGNMPLSLSFPPIPRIPLGLMQVRGRNADLRRLLSILSPYFPRWKKVDISLEGLYSELSEIVTFQDDGGRKPFQSIEQFNLRVVMIEGHLEADKFRRQVSMLLSELGLGSSKHLRKLGLYLDRHTRLYSESQGLNNFFPSGQLEALDLQGNLLLDEGARIPLDLLPSILQTCPGLVVFKANVEYPQARFPPVSSSRIPLFMLKEVSLFFQCDHDWMDSHILSIIARCDWPALTSLYLRSVNPPYADMSLLSACTDQFSIPLTSLRLNSFGIRTQTLIDLMYALPTLVQLHLDHPVLSGLRQGEPTCGDELIFELFDDNIISHLTPKPNGTPHALPQLRFLKWERNTRFSDKALAILLQQRSASPYSPVPMRQVHIYFGREIQEDILPICSNLIEAGLDLRLRYPPAFDTSFESTYQDTDYVQPVKVDYRTFGWD